MNAQQSLNPNAAVRPEEPTVGGMLGAPVAIVLALAVFIAPVTMLAVASLTAVVGLVSRYGLRKLVAQIEGRKRTVTVPGLGTVTYRITPQKH